MHASRRHCHEKFRCQVHAWGWAATKAHLQPLAACGDFEQLHEADRVGGQDLIERNVEARVRGAVHDDLHLLDSARFGEWICCERAMVDNKLTIAMGATGAQQI